MGWHSWLNECGEAFHQQTKKTYSWRMLKLRITIIFYDKTSYQSIVWKSSYFLMASAISTQYSCIKWYKKEKTCLFPPTCLQNWEMYRKSGSNLTIEESIRRQKNSFKQCKSWNENHHIQVRKIHVCSCPQKHESEWVNVNWKTNNVIQTAILSNEKEYRTIHSWIPSAHNLRFSFC